MRFIKRPVVIDAEQFLPPCQDCVFRIASVSPDGSFTYFTVFRDEIGEHLRIETLEGTHRANPGDWIIRGVKGEFYPCKDDIFRLTYEPEPKF